MPGSALPQDAKLRRLAALVPAVVRRLLIRHAPSELRGWHENVELACLFADVSGFTPLVEALASRGKEGLEQLRSVLNRLYDALVTAAERSGGEILRYAGDAMTVLVRHDGGAGPALAVAIDCARALQQAMSEFQQRLPKALPPLGLKVGVGAGPMTFAIVGWPSMELAVDGTALRRAVSAEHRLERGEIGVDIASVGLSGRTVDPSGEICEGDTWILRDDTATLASPGTAEPSIALPTLDRLAPFILEPLFQRIVSGSMDLLYEHRKLRVMFLRFDGIDCGKPEDILRLDRFFAEAAAAVRRHGGFLTELDIGDKGSNLIGIFGAPVAIEEPWSAAAKAALEIVALSRRHGLSAKAGLACGPVFCGEIGARSRLQYTVFGEAINRSARLMVQAAAEQVLVDPALMEELGADFVIETLPPRKLKGFSEPVAIGRLVARRDDTVVISSEPLVGRSSELRRLEELWTGARQGRGASLALVGPPGIGKSRLLQELAATASRDEGLVLTARGTPEEQGLPLASVHSMLSSLLDGSFRTDSVEPGRREPGRRGLEADAVEPMRQKEAVLPRLLQLASGGAVSAEANADVALQSALAVADRLLTEEAKKRPVLLLFEDLHWMDQASLDLVKDQIRNPADRALLLVLTARSAPHLGGFEPEQLDLGAWNEVETMQAVQQAFGAELLDQELLQLLRRQSQGNPLMVRELCRHLVSNGRIEVSPYGQAYLTGPAEEGLPGSLEALMLARLDQRPAAVRRLLQVASCIGVEFEVALLGRACRLEASRVGPGLQEALDTGLVAKVSPDRWSFPQPILQETIHGALARADRRRLHRHVAEELVRVRSAGQTIEPARLAYHYALAGLKSPAYRYSCEAAEAARAHGSMREALSHLDRAVELLGSASLSNHRTDLPELLARRSEIHCVLGQPDEAAADGIRLAKLAKRRRNPEFEARGWLLKSQAESAASRYPEAASAATQALVLANTLRVPRLRARALLELGRLNVHQGAFEVAHRQLTEALQASDSIEDPIGSCRVHQELGRLFAKTSRRQEAEEHYRTALQVFEELDDFQAQLRCIEGLGYLSASAGELEAWKVYASKALDLARRIGSRLGEATALQFLASYCRLSGHPDRAEESLRQSIAAFHRAGNLGGMASCTNNLAVLLHLQHRWTEAEAEYNQALDLMDRSRNFSLRPAVVNNLGELHEDQGDLERASVEYRRGLESARQMRNATEEAKALLGLARYERSRERLDDAASHVSACIELAQQSGLGNALVQASEMLQQLRAGVR